LPLAKDKNSQARLMEIIQHDVRRLDRLITDISDASRLDAELVREEAEPVDMKRLVENIVEAARNVSSKKKQVEILVEINEKHGRNFIVSGHDLRLGQVVTNLIENARSFVPENTGKIRLTLSRTGKRIILTVEDNGPGIRPDSIRSEERR